MIYIPIIFFTILFIIKFLYIDFNEIKLLSQIKEIKYINSTEIKPTIHNFLYAKSTKEIYRISYMEHSDSITLEEFSSGRVVGFRKGDWFHLSYLRKRLIKRVLNEIPENLIYLDGIYEYEKFLDECRIKAIQIKRDLIVNSICNSR